MCAAREKGYFFGVLLFLIGIIVAAMTASSSPDVGIVIMVLGIPGWC